MKLIKIRDLKVSFEDKNTKQSVDIIRGIDLDIAKGKIYGFIGESGSGKSVTSKTLFDGNSQASVSAKKFDLFGHDLLSDKSKVLSKDKKWKEIRGKKIAYIPQDSYASLNPTMKIKNQILKGMELHSSLETKEEMIDRAIELLEMFGIENAKKRIEQYPHHFSGGMRQRILIAMMVAMEPEVLIADEPTTALDPSIQNVVLNYFKKIVKDFNISLILVSHDISVMASIADYMYVFYAGRIIEKGNKKDIFTDPKHPYTWALLSSLPELGIKGEELYSIKGTPPDFRNLPTGDPFSVRNDYALKYDFVEEPDLFKVSNTHYAATWLLHPDAEKIELPKSVKQIIKIMKKEFKNE